MQSSLAVSQTAQATANGIKRHALSVVESFSEELVASITQSAPEEKLAQSHRASQWQALPKELHDITTVVGPQSQNLEKTTLLTWLYQNSGSMAYVDIAERVIRPGRAAQRRITRRVLKTLERMGVICLTRPTSATESQETQESLEEEADFSTTDLASDDCAPADAAPMESGELIALDTVANITKLGNLWLQRAWRARYVSLCRESPGIEWIHRCYLEEEEEGKGGELVWIESIGTRHEPHPNTGSVPSGLITSGIGRVASVFDLGLVKTAKSRAKPRTSALFGRGKYKD